MQTSTAAGHQHQSACSGLLWPLSKPHQIDVVALSHCDLSRSALQNASSQLLDKILEPLA
ncbi:hypothetical protein D3C85_1713290 [compost metagenome]